MKARRGFTLVELMVASSIFALVVGGTVGAFVGIQRMTRTALAETEMAIAMREVREKLLFHLSRPEEGQSTAGLLSGAAFDAASCRSSDWMNRTGLLDWSEVDVGGSSDGLYWLDLEMTVESPVKIPGSGEITRRERVTVPVFGVEQTGGLP